MNEVCKKILGSALCASIMFSGMTVNASSQVATTDTISTDLYGYTLYVYENDGSRELGRMHLQKTSNYAKNTFTNSSRCAPYVQVQARGTYNWSSAGSRYGLESRGYTITASQKISSGIETILGRAEVGYDDNDH